MKANIVKILWGIVLIGFGVLFLSDTLGYINLDLTGRQGGVISFAVLSGGFFLSYLLEGIRKWGWLFPALLCAAAALIFGALLESRGELVALPILLSVGIPFYVGYLVDRKQWGLLIPAWVMTVISVILVLSVVENPDLIGATVLFAIALPFIVVYLANHQRKWALIVGTVLAFIGLFPLLGPILPQDYAGPVIMFLFALFFFAIYLFTHKAWWSLIPSGVFFSIGVVALLETLLPNRAYFMVGELQFNGYSSVLLLGFAATFAVLWLLRANHPTAWAKYPAIGLLILSILSLIMWKTASNLVLAIALLVRGVALILASVLKRRGPGQLTSRNI